MKKELINNIIIAIVLTIMSGALRNEILTNRKEVEDRIVRLESELREHIAHPLLDQNREEKHDGN